MQSWMREAMQELFGYLLDDAIEYPEWMQTATVTVLVQNQEGRRR